MSNRRDAHKYLKSIDLYSEGISLTYNGKKTFPTFCGGVATLVTILLCFAWFVSAIINAALHPTKNYTMS